MEKYVKASDAAKRLKTTRAKIADLIASGVLPHQVDPLDKRVKLIPLSAIERMVREREGIIVDPKGTAA